MKRLLVLLMMCGGLAGALQGAVTEPFTTATVTLTNLANIVPGTYIDINGDIRRNTNGAPALASKWVHITNSLANMTTNLIRHFGVYSPSGPVDVSTNSCNSTNFNLVGAPSQILVVTISGNWASVTYVTNQWTNTFPVYMPFTTELLTTRTGIVSDVVASLNNYASNGLGTGTVAMAKFQDLLSAQITSNKTHRAGKIEDAALTNSNVQRLNFKPLASATSPTNFGVLVFFDRLTNQTATMRPNSNGIPSLYDSTAADPWSNDELFVALSTNNWGAIMNLFSIVTQFPLLSAQPNAGRYSNSIPIPNYWTSPTNTFTSGLQLPGGFTATYGTWKGGTAETARVIVTNLTSGSNATVLLTNLSGEAKSLIVTNLTSGSNATILLTNLSGEANSLVITTLVAKAGSTENLTHHKMIGSNVVFATGSSNTLGGDWSFPMYANATLANGDNSEVDFGTNTFVALTGPSADYTISSFKGPRDGRMVYIYFGAAYNVTIRNDSGVGSPPTANRILTLSGADQQSSGSAMAATFYNPTLARWIFSWLNRGSGAGSAGVNFDTNSFNVNGGMVVITTNFVATGMVMRAQAKLNANIEGQIWNDATQRVLRTYNSGVTQALVGTLISLTNSVACANTTSETSFFPLGSSVGDTNLSTTFWAPGKRVRIDVSGIWQASGAISKTFRVRIGSATPVSIAYTPAGPIGPGIRFRFVATLTCRATGSSGTVVQSALAEMWTSASAVSYAATASSSTTTINTTTAHAIDVTVQHSSAGASDTITAVEGSIEVLN